MKKQPTQDQAKSALECILGQKTVGFYPVIAKALGSAPAAIMVSQAFFWQYKAKFGSPIVIDGEQYFSKTVAEWYEETSVSESAQRLARSILTKHGIMVEKLAGLPASMHFRVDINALVAVINGYLSTGITVAAKHGNKERELTRTGSGKFRRQEATKDGDILNVETSESFESEGEITPPAPNPSNLQSQKKESGLVAAAENPETVKAEKKEKDFIPRGAAPADCDGSYGVGKIEFYPAAAENPETVKAETPPLPKVAPKGIPPVRLDAKEIRGLVDLTETYPFGFCETCQGQKVVGGRNGLIECPTCEGTGLGNGRTESENPPPAQFEVTAIASPTSCPGVTLVEAAPKIQPSPRVATTIEAEQKIIEWAAFGGIETVRQRHNLAMRRFKDEDMPALAAHYCSVYTKNPANKERLLKDPVTHFSDGLFSYLKNEESFGRNNAPKDGGATRQNGHPEKTLISNMRQL